MNVYKRGWWRITKTAPRKIWIGATAQNIYWQEGRICPEEMRQPLASEGCPNWTWSEAKAWIETMLETEKKSGKGKQYKPTQKPIPEPVKITVQPEPVVVVKEKTKKPEPETDRLQKLITAAKLSGHGLYLYGEAGIGKSYGIENAAKQLGLDFYTTGACLDDVPLKGYKDANGVYQETQLYKAVKNGGLFLLDEMDVCTSEVLLTLNQLLANRSCEFGGELVKAHKDFIFCATGNTDLDGGDENYNGRQIIDKSFKTRFIIEKIEYQYETAVKIAGNTETVKALNTVFSQNVNYRAIKEYVGLIGAGFQDMEAFTILEKSLIKAVA